MIDFRKWAKARHFRFKHPKEEKKALAIWKACQADQAEDRRQLNDIGQLLESMQIELNAMTKENN